MAIAFRFNPKKFFFDKPYVQSMLRDGEAKALSRAGSYTRGVAYRMLGRTGKGPSQPGKPPRRVTGKLREFVRFEFEPRRRAVIIGPEAFNMVSLAITKGRKLSKRSGVVPALHEFGGRQGIIERWIDPIPEKGVRGQWIRRDLRYARREGERTRIRFANYPKRPYMGPSLRVSQTKFASFFFNVMRK